MELGGQTVAGVLLAVAFGAVALIAPGRAVYLLAVLGVFRTFQAFVFAGSRVEQGLFPAEIMATVCLGLAILQSASGHRSPTPPEIDRPFLWLIGVAVVSLVVNLYWIDPAVNRIHVKPLVSVGQILLLVWPLALYRFVARSVDTEATPRRLLAVIAVLAAPSLLVPMASAPWRSALSWSVYFGLAAAPFCFAQMFFVRSRIARLGLLALAVAPAVNGLYIGKTFLYGFVGVFVSAICVIRAPRLALASLVFAAGTYVALIVPLTGSLLPGPLEQLVATERQQGSWGGASGRLQLAIDTVTIWSRHPMLGVGPGNSWPYMHRYSVIDTPHNQYLNVLLETGLAGLVAFVALLLGCLRVGWRLYQSAQSDFIEMFALGWLGYFLGMVLGGLTGDFVLHSIRNGGLELFTGFYLQWVMLGLLVALSRLSARAAAAGPQVRAA